MESFEQGKAMNRRSVVKAAAWAAPVVAVAATAPLAAASARQATLFAGTGGSIVANQGAGTASGTLAGQVIIENVINGPWATGALAGRYLLAGPWAAGATITQANGDPFVQGSDIVVNGVTWTVSYVHVSGREVRFTAPSQSVNANTTFVLPAAIYSGPFNVGATDEFNPIAAQVSVQAANVNNGNGVSTSNGYPANIPE